jgi:ABC-type phosphate/phosphonate transport system substrate-binding protein
MSTPLPTLPPTIAPGSADNPVRIVFVNDAAGRAADNAAETLQEALQEATGLTVSVSLQASDRDAVQTLCDAFGGPQALAFVSGPGYSAASALGCGAPLFLAQGEDDALNREIMLIASEDSEIAVLSDLADKMFCRLAASDLDTWQAPSLLMLAEGLSPTSVLQAVEDVADLDTLVERVASGDCDAAALAVTDFERIAGSEMQETIARLPQTVAVPYGVMMIPPDMPLGVREALVEALRDFGRSSSGPVTLEALTGASSLIPFTEGALDDWDAFIARTGLDFAGFATE